MFHLTLMGGSVVRLKEQDNIVITVWGGTDILMPTLAEKIARLKKYQNDQDSMVRRTNVITFQGGTVYKLPTLAREIEEMVALRESNMLSDQEFLELWQIALQRDDFDILESWTLMGGAGEERPSAREEIKDLQRLVLKGILTTEEFRDIKTFLSSKEPPGFKTRVPEKLRELFLGTSRPPQLSSNSSASYEQPEFLKDR